MHFKSILHVRDHSKAAGTAHHLLSTIANHVNMHTGEAFGPSVDRLATRLDVTPQWVRQLRARLVAEGELLIKPSRGRHPNVYMIPYERCPACQGLNPKVELRDEITPDDANPKVPILQPVTLPETCAPPTRNVCPANPKVEDLPPDPQPESLTAPTRNSGDSNPKLGATIKAVMARIELRKEFLKEEKEKEKGATRKSREGTQYKPERLSPYWCEAHGFCHSERLEDHRPDCMREP